ncbi:MAG: hypothetical protein AAF637_10745 [Pseudomonadota bacterium]
MDRRRGLKMRALVIFGLVALALPNLAAAETLVLYGVGGNDIVTTKSDDGTRDLYLWNVPLEDDTGARVGISDGFCFQTDRQNEQFCSWVIRYEQHGQIAVMGVQSAKSGVAPMIIVGGTGTYAGARGTLVSIPVYGEGDDRSELPPKWRYDITYETDMKTP